MFELMIVNDPAKVTAIVVVKKWVIQKYLSKRLPALCHIVV
jgi:hypothetical protein